MRDRSIHESEEQSYYSVCVHPRSRELGAFIIKEEGHFVRRSWTLLSIWVWSHGPHNLANRFCRWAYVIHVRKQPKDQFLQRILELKPPQNACGSTSIRWNNPDEIEERTHMRSAGVCVLSTNLKSQLSLKQISVNSSSFIMNDLLRANFTVRS